MYIIIIIKMCNKSSFENLKKTPEDSREELMKAGREGRRVLRHSTRRGIGIGSSWQVLEADFKMNRNRLQSADGGAVKRICH